MRHKDHTGLIGEEAAARYLTERGHEVLDRRWRSRTGELDLVTDDGGELVAVEVKTRRGTDFGHPVEAISPDKLHRLHRLLHEFAAAQGTRWARRRVDVLGIVLAGPPPSEDVASVDHLKDVLP